MNTASGLCWCCTATPPNFRICGSIAPWKKQRLTPEGFMKKLHQEGVRPSVLFSSPGASAAQACPDWLHCADLGVSQDVIGNMFLKLVDFVSRPKQKSKDSTALV